VSRIKTKSNQTGENLIVKRRAVLAILLSILCFSSSALAQNYRGTIRGRITAPNGQIVPGAEVKLTREETNQVRLAKTNSSGEYAFTLLPPGKYRVEIEQASINNKYAHQIDLLVNQDVRLDISFTSTTHRETIELVESLTPTKKDSASLGAVIDNNQITGLPLDGRNFLELSLLVPGAAPSAQGSAGTVRGDFAFKNTGTSDDSKKY
jgi:hypothetical protein